MGKMVLCRNWDASGKIYPAILWGEEAVGCRLGCMHYSQCTIMAQVGLCASHIIIAVLLLHCIHDTSKA